MSTITVANVSDGVDTVATTYVTSGVSKQSLNFDQPTVTIRSSVNTSSVIDVATGQPEPQFTNNFADGFYVPSCIVESTATSGADRVAQVIDYDADKTTDGCQYMTTGNAGAIDYQTSSFIQGDLA